MDSPQWWLTVAIVVTLVFALAIGAIAYSLWLDKQPDDEERRLPPAE